MEKKVIENKISNTRHYLIYLGETYSDPCDNILWDDIDVGDKGRIIHLFHQEMINVFSQCYEYPIVELDEISIRKLKQHNCKHDLYFELETDGTIININLQKGKSASFEECNCHSFGENKNDDIDQYLLYYGVSGGLHLDMYALMFTDNTPIKYKRPQPKEIKENNDKEDDDKEYNENVSQFLQDKNYIHSSDVSVELYYDDGEEEFSDENLCWNLYTYLNRTCNPGIVQIFSDLSRHAATVTQSRALKPYKCVSLTEEHRIEIEKINMLTLQEIGGESCPIHPGKTYEIYLGRK